MATAVMTAAVMGATVMAAAVMGTTVMAAAVATVPAARINARRSGYCEERDDYWNNDEQAHGSDLNLESLSFARNI